MIFPTMLKIRGSEDEYVIFSFVVGFFILWLTCITSFFTIAFKFIKCTT